MVQRSEPGAVSILKNLKNTALPIDICLMEKEFSIGQLLTLSPGSVLSFDLPANTPAQLVVNGTSVAEGRVVQVGENYGVQVDKVCTTES